MSLKLGSKNHTLNNGLFFLRIWVNIYLLMKPLFLKENATLSLLIRKPKGKKGTIVAILAGTKVEPIIEQLFKIPKTLRDKVKEITLDMANSMKIIVKKCFPKAIQVTDRFHVQKLAIEALQQIRIKHRWEAIDIENEQIRQAKGTQKNFSPEFFCHGGTRKQRLRI